MQKTVLQSLRTSFDHSCYNFYLFFILATPLKILKLWKDLFLCIIKIFL